MRAPGEGRRGVEPAEAVEPETAHDASPGDDTGMVTRCLEVEQDVEPASVPSGEHGILEGHPHHSGHESEQLQSPGVAEPGEARPRIESADRARHRGGPQEAAEAADGAGRGDQTGFELAYVVRGPHSELARNEVTALTALREAVRPLDRAGLVRQPVHAVGAEQAGVPLAGTVEAGH